jgi:hypothetical protein
MSKIRLISSAALAIALAASAISGAASAQDGKSAKAAKADRVDNGPTVASGAELLRAKNARLGRTKDGLKISMKLVTPEAGSYTYPETVTAERQAQPEAFTGWVFIFNNPDKCVSNPGEQFPCGPADFNDEVRAGVYNFSGFTNSLAHISGSDLMLNPHTNGLAVLAGGVEVGQQQLPPVVDGTTTHPLENPMGAEVHVAIAPHGQLDPMQLPDELYRPAGNPNCECWWVATFSGDI